MLLGQLRIKDFLERTNGQVRGQLVSDAKIRYYAADYDWNDDPISPEYVVVRRADGTGDTIRVKASIDLDESLVAFFGLYSGDGAKGSESATNLGQVSLSISFSQREPNLVAFAVKQFRRVFEDAIRFTFSLGEDSAYFMDGEGLQLLIEYYDNNLPPTPSLPAIRPTLNTADLRYLREIRPSQRSAEEDLAFYYFHRTAMGSILTAVKLTDVQRANISLQSNDRVTASLRRPFKKGARVPGGSSRSDEMHVGGLNRLGELFLKMLHEVESSILEDTQISSQGLVYWNDRPSNVGEMINLIDFFQTHNYGQLAGRRPTLMPVSPDTLLGYWRGSSEVHLKPQLRIDPLWCYTSGLYLAEGRTSKDQLFSMFKKWPGALSLGFTSSENTSLELILKALNRLFSQEDCLDSWKIKVGSQYFPEMVVVGLKQAVPMLRGGQSGDGKLRTMEISLAIKEWALQMAPGLLPYADKYTHVEPTGAGVPRIDFSASSALCKWYFPLVMYAVFGHQVTNPSTEFI